MSRKKRGQPVHGWLILDKPSGMTSTSAVNKLKWLFDAQKAGHAGTLDPLATGVLPIAFGEATKTMPFVMDGDKTYRFLVRWGVETNTDDAEGEAVATGDRRPSRAEIEALLPAFTGAIDQVPPAYSAVKIDGERAYKLAREGEEVAIEPRRVQIDELFIVDQPDADHTRFETRCGTGTYVRSLARDMGRRLGCYGHIAELRRTRVGSFGEDMSISLDKLEQLGHSPAGREALLAELLPVATALDDIPALAVDRNDAFRLKRGQSVLLRGADSPIIKGPVYATLQGSLVAIGEIRRGELRPVRVFNF
jgi:tRNA pseudouridine55 synthase